MRFKFIIYSLLLFVACQTDQKEITVDEMKILVEQRTTELQQAVMSGNLTARMNFYDTEASLSPDGFPLLQGRDSIQELLERGMKMAKFTSLDFETQYVNGNRDYIYQMGIMHSNILVYDTLDFDNSAKFMLLWKRQDDESYMIVVEMTNSLNEDFD